MRATLHNYSVVRYLDAHAGLQRTRYTGLHALHLPSGRVEYRAYLDGHIRHRCGSQLCCRLAHALIARRERILRGGLVWILRRGWLGPEAQLAIRVALLKGRI